MSFYNFYWLNHVLNQSLTCINWYPSGIHSINWSLSYFFFNCSFQFKIFYKLNQEIGVNWLYWIDSTLWFLINLWLISFLDFYLNQKFSFFEVHTTMANFNMNTMSNFSHFLGSSKKILMLIPEYYEQCSGRMEDYLNGSDEDLMISIKRWEFFQAMLVDVGTTASSDSMITWGSMMKETDKKCMCELCGALPPVVCNYVRGWKTTKKIWDTLKEKYQGNEKTKKSPVKQCLLELGEFKQKKIESMESYYDRLNKLIFKCSHFGVTHLSLDFNLTFLMGLR